MLFLIIQFFKMNMPNFPFPSKFFTSE